MDKYKISGLPVVDDDGKLIGILTNRDLRFVKHQDFSKPISMFMTSKNLITAKEGISLEDATEILRAHKIEKLPIVDDEGKSERANHHKGYNETYPISRSCKRQIWKAYGRGCHRHRSRYNAPS